MTPVAHPDFDIDEEPPYEVAASYNPLPIEDLSTLLARVDSAPPPKYLVRPVIAAGDHGMFAAEFKAGKTWAMSDLAVSVTSGTAWLGVFDVETRGPVLLFAGEGGPRKFTRRLRAVCASRGLDPAGLPIRVCMRVPHLTSEAAMTLVEAEIEQHRPVLVIIDPLYLAARGARGSDLYEMGSHLEGIQVVCQRHGAALLIAHHWNKTGDGRGAKRMSGAGPDAWGRVLISAAVVSRHADRDTGGSSVVLDLDFQGDEIPETTTRIRRKVWADDPNDLASAMHYEVEQLAAELGTVDVGDGLRPAARRVLAVLDNAGEWETVRSIGDALADDPTGLMPLKARTIQAALTELVNADLAVSAGLLGGSAGRWRSTRAQSAEIEDKDAF
jgi:AAA domain